VNGEQVLRVKPSRARRALVRARRLQCPDKRPHNIIGINAADHIGNESRHLRIKPTITQFVDREIPTAKAEARETSRSR